VRTDELRANIVDHRLHLQHWIFTHQLGYLLHPKISVGEKPLRIADVACGNAYVYTFVKMGE